VFLQFSGPRPWYLKLHKSNYTENRYEGPVVIHSTPVEIMSFVNFDTYLIRLVHNIHCLFTAICGGK